MNVSIDGLSCKKGWKIIYLFFLRYLYMSKIYLLWMVWSLLPLYAFGNGFQDDRGKRKHVEPDRWAGAVKALQQEEYVCLSQSDGWGRILSGWEKQKVLDRMADSEALAELADKHSSAIVRTVSFLLLVRRGERSCIPVLFAHLRDTATIGVQVFDVIYSPENIANVMVSLVESHDENKRDKLLMPKDSARLDNTSISTVSGCSIML